MNTISKTEIRVEPLWARISIRQNDGNGKNLVSLYDRIHFDTLDIEMSYTEMDSECEHPSQYLRIGQFLKIGNCNYKVVDIYFEMITCNLSPEKGKNTLEMSADGMGFGVTGLSPDSRMLPYNCIIQLIVEEVIS